MKFELHQPHHHSVFTYAIDVKPSDIDELGHVNNVVYLRWVQQVASAHWESRMPVSAGGYLWVVLRHEIDYLRPALLNDKLTGLTWVIKMEGVKSTRIVKFIANGYDIAQAKTVWCSLDASTMKPKRIGDDIRDIFA